VAQGGEKRVIKNVNICIKINFFLLMTNLLFPLLLIIDTISNNMQIILL